MAYSIHSTGVGAYIPSFRLVARWKWYLVLAGPWPLLAVVAETRLLLRGAVFSGSGSSSGAVVCWIHGVFVVHTDDVTSGYSSPNPKTITTCTIKKNTRTYIACPKPNN